MFLQAEYFEAQEAAARPMEFMEEKLMLIGSDALSRPVQMDDLENESRKILKSGKGQLLSLLPVGKGQVEPFLAYFK